MCRVCNGRSLGRLWGARVAVGACDGVRAVVRILATAWRLDSAWNKENRFTGWTDVPLSEKGHEEAVEAGRLLKERGFTFDIAFTSVLKRAIRTLWFVGKEGRGDREEGKEKEEGRWVGESMYERVLWFRRAGTCWRRRVWSGSPCSARGG